MTVETSTLSADVIVVGSGAAGMYASLEAQRLGADVILIDKSVLGRGGATVMAQMTVAAALGHAEPDTPDLHFLDTINGSKGLAGESLVELLCVDGPRRVLEARDLGVNWAAEGDRLTQVAAPGHSRRRCCYVDVLATGQSVSRALRVEVRRRSIRVAANVIVTEVLTSAGQVDGVVGLDLSEGVPVVAWAPAVILACGGLTEMYARNSASVNMTGDAFGLALGAGAELIDMEMIQFFPIAHLAPRLIGLDPIMWDPFRYKLGGRLLNGQHEEFIHRYASTADEGQYRATRDVVSYAILKEVEAGRGSPAGGAYLDFTGIGDDAIHAAFPPVVDRLVSQGIHLNSQAVEVAPMAHYTIGGIRVAPDMATSVDGLFAAGEAVGGVHGSNRLSGNAITEAFVFGAVAGKTAARYASTAPRAINSDARRRSATTAEHIASYRGRSDGGMSLPACRRRMQEIMWTRVGPFRDAAGLEQARLELKELAGEVSTSPIGSASRHNLQWAEALEMELMLVTAESLRLAALAREESRGAHQREDYPTSDEAMASVNGVITARDGALLHRWEPLSGSKSSLALDKRRRQ